MSDYFLTGLTRNVSSALRSSTTKSWINIFNKLVVIVFVCSLVCVAGCSTTALPTEKEHNAIQTGNQAFVLLRVTSEYDGQAYETFSPDGRIGLALGGFMTGGKVKHVDPLRYLSDKTRYEGWTYFVLDPGSYYLAVLPTRMTNIFTYLAAFKYAPRWRIDVPEDAKIVYAGTLHIPGVWKKFAWSSQYYLVSFRKEDSSVLSEEELAQTVVTENLPDVFPLKTVLMRPHDDGPLILRTPSRSKNE